jgi:acyl-[acyl-carrier-protein]-phospholipid O-acyltransferase/long-chain-fatty-acid--[acyl-carrier-protein] ligase
LRSYLKRCNPEEFASLEIVIAGAEKLPKSLSDAFEERFGVRPVEGYGTTELSPLVSVNIPPSRSHGTGIVAKEGTVGRCVPGVSAKVVDAESFEPLADGEAGMLLIKGPNVMKGYMGQPDKTTEVIRDGWYVTGDIARIDDDGFIEITGRLSRFSKIGGEMVPHLKVEEALERVLDLGDSDEVVLAVASVPDERKGERLVVVHRPLEKSPQAICDALRGEGLPNLWIPDRDAFVEVEQIPVLGTGKLDLKGLSELVKERIGGRQPIGGGVVRGS